MEAKKKRRILLIMGSIMIGLAVLLILIFFLRGKMTVTGEFPRSVADSSMKCIGENIEYPFIHYNELVAQNTTSINIVFRNGKIGEISLLMADRFSDERAASAGASVAHADMNQSFANYGLMADALSAGYQVSDSTLRMNLFAPADELDRNSSQYFLLDSAMREESMAELKTHYEGHGFICTSSE